LEVHEQIVARRFVLVDVEGNPAAYITGAEVCSAAFGYYLDFSRFLIIPLKSALPHGCS
jgi:hypothetical protein